MNTTEQKPTEKTAAKSVVDILIVGAGISGVGAACYFQRELPTKKIMILERRKAVGGTWDLFRYPGIRSDSDMNTFGYGFRPWTETRVLSDGPAIKQYIEDTARENNIYKYIQFGMKVKSASHESKTSRWTVIAENEEDHSILTVECNFFISATGYYKYDAGYKPEFPGEQTFKGQIVHPQQWPENLDYKGKKVVVIGSGATAVTLIPAMADKTSHITMLQRSPTYILSIPKNDVLSENLRKFLPASVVYSMARTRNILLQKSLYALAKAQPGIVRNLILNAVKSQLGDEVDISHFTPKYNPWDERLCVVPEGDLFKTLKSGKASVVTDTIDTFTETGIQLKSGKFLEADIIVTATGLDLQLLGGIQVKVDNREMNLPDRLTYKAVLLEDVPNMALIFGYTNASWTLKVDIACEYLCRLVKYMDEHGYRTVKTRPAAAFKTEETVMGGLSSGYIQRAVDQLPKQGSEGVWKVTNDYLSDLATLKFGSIADDQLIFQ